MRRFRFGIPGIRWAHESLPEFDGVPSAVRERAWRHCQAVARRGPAAWATQIGTTVLAVVVLVYWREWAWDFGVGVGRGGDGLVAVCAAWTFAQIERGQRFRAARRLVPTVLPGHCRTCGYDLAHNVSGFCPECGTVPSPTADPLRAEDEWTGRPANRRVVRLVRAAALIVLLTCFPVGSLGLVKTATAQPAWQDWGGWALAVAGVGGFVGAMAADAWAAGRLAEHRRWAKRLARP